MGDAGWGMRDAGCGMRDAGCGCGCDSYGSAKGHYPRVALTAQRTFPRCRTLHFESMNQPLAETIFWIAALACALAEIAILRSTIAQKRSHNPSLVRAGSQLSELIWAVIPAVALSLLLIATWRRIEAREN